jgi:hypothetical protein
LKKEKRCKSKGYIIYSTENFPNLEKKLPFRYRKPPEHQTDLSKIGPLHGILSLKQVAKEQRKNIKDY